jgi:signal transduction histidine kinase
MVVGRHRTSFYLPLLAGMIILGLGVFGFTGLLTRPNMPWAALARATGVPARDLPRAWDHDTLTPFGQAALRRAVVSADGFEIRDRDFDFSFIAARHRIGDPIEFVVDTGAGGTVRVSAPLVAYYAKHGLPVVFLLTGVFGFLIGYGVFVLRAEDRRARLFFWLCLAFSAAVMISGEWYGVQGRPLHLVPGVLFFIGYILTPVLLLKFALSFVSSGRFRGEALLWAAAALFAAFFSAVLLSALLVPSIAIFRLKSYFSVFRVFFAVVAIASVLFLFRAYRSAPTRERRDQVRWVLVGLLTGLGPFLVFYTLPRVFGSRSLLSEEAASAFFVLMPLALAFAILKYKLLDVNVLIKRSVVYSLLTMLTVGVYLLSLEALRALFAVRAGAGRGWIPVGSAFIAAMAFAPARSRIQVLVDRAFFRQSYDYRRALRNFVTAAGKVHSAPGLLALFSRTLEGALPVERVGAVLPAAGVAKPGAIETIGLDEDALAGPFAVPDGPGRPPSAPELRRAGYETILSLPIEETGPCGWVFVGPKKSGLAFTEEDEELLRALADEMAGALRRVRLQEEVIYERASREKLEELGRMKTEFISAVSHELRTPMTSLQAISELLKSGKVADAARRDQLLDLMAGECGRLGRFLHNVLDFGRIEQDAKHYDFREVDLGPLVTGVVEVIRSAACAEDLVFEIARPDGPVPVEADPDAVRQALLNIVDNAIKYSAGRKRVAVRVAVTEAGAEIGVTDNGIGIPPEDRERIFEAFYRSPEAVRHDAKGVGLGLMIVKHIMDAHGGRIAVEGGPGRGTTVILKFPRRRKP